MALKIVELKTFAAKIVLAAVGLAALCNALASRADRMQLAELSVRLAPDDPQTHYIAAALSERNFQLEDFQKAAAEYEKAAALSPNDFRYWFQLGRARGRVGDAEGAEKAMRRALELAPNYSEIQWTLGNMLLRRGNFDEAFNLIRLAAGGNEKFVNPAISTAWQIFDGDISQIKSNIGDSPEINAALASFLAGQKRFDEAVDVWNNLPAERRNASFKEIGTGIYNQLIAAQKFRLALKIWKDASDGSRGYEVGKITNAGFEINEKQEKTSVFDWQIADGTQPLVGVDAGQIHGGNLSQRIIFNSPNGADFRQISQLVVVEAGKKYEFSLFYKSDLKTSATLRWEIVNASDGQILTATAPVAANSEWARLDAQFTAPQNSDAVIIRLARVACGSTICPISGSVWFDDFALDEK
jgi:tetratricopeptide (TPR) repeat protein